MSHIHEKIDFTAEIFIVDRDKVLLRKHDKYKKWFAVGGHIELDEEPEQAAVREAKEEVGLDVELVPNEDSYQPRERDGFKELIAPRYMNRHRINETHDHITMVFFARALSHDIVNEGREKSEEIRWFTREELHDAGFGVPEDITRYAEKALGTLSGR